MSWNCFPEHDSVLSEPIGSGISSDPWDLDTFEGTATRSPSSGAHLECGGKSACHHGGAGLHLHGSTIWNKILVHGMFRAPFWTYAINTEGSSFFLLRLTVKGSWLRKMTQERQKAKKKKKRVPEVCAKTRLAPTLWHQCAAVAHNGAPDTSSVLRAAPP